MTRDLKELYMAVLKKGFRPRVRKDTNIVIDLESSEGNKCGSITLVPNDFWSAVKPHISNRASPFFLKLREDDANIRRCEINAPERPVFAGIERERYYK